MRSRCTGKNFCDCIVAAAERRFAASVVGEAAPAPRRSRPRGTRTAAVTCSHCQRRFRLVDGEASRDWSALPGAALRRERADDLGRHVVGVTRLRWRNDGLTAGRRAGGVAGPRRVLAARGNTPSPLASVGRSTRRPFGVMADRGRSWVPRSRRSQISDRAAVHTVRRYQLM